MSLFEKKKPGKVKQNRSFFEVVWDYIQSLGVALILALMIKTSVVEAYKIPSGSMGNTLLVGDFLLANKFIYGMRLPIPFTNIKLPALAEPKPGDVIIFKYPGDLSQNYIKRCIAVEGQRIRIANKQVYVDGQPITLPPHGQYADPNHMYPYVDDGRWEPTRQGGRIFSFRGRRDNMPETVVPKGMLFMMGDNRDNSADSRFWGFLDRRLVLGKAMMIHWSWQSYDSGGPAVKFPRPPKIEASNPFSIVENIAFNIYYLPERVRWARIGDIIR
jgi:signal peptidase I